MNPISLVFINGVFVEAQSTLSALPADVEFHARGGVYLKIPKSLEITIPIHLKFLSRDTQGLSNVLHHIIDLEENSKITLIEEYSESGAENYSNNVTMEITLHKNARLNYYKLQKKVIVPSICRIWLYIKKKQVL